MTKKTVKKIRKQMNLWEPQILGLRRLDSTLYAVNLDESLDSIEASANKRFDTNFPSFCFALATGTGKTRLMGASMAYLYREYSYKNFFILTPGRTIYDKTSRELSPSHPKYIFNGLSPFPSPQVITGENYHWQSPDPDKLTVYLFNIQKIFNPRKDVEFKFHRFKEELGMSFADILRESDDLVVLMDESHRYRGAESMRAIHSLKPRLGLEYTATPRYKKNVIVKYGLKRAREDGIIKRVQAVYRENDASYEEELENLKLQDGARIHLKKKKHIQAYCKNHDIDSIKPVLFINSLEVEEGKRLKKKIESDDFMNGRFKDKVLFIHYKNKDEEEEKLVSLEDPSNPYEVVIHVNKLREGWDVKNIFTLVPFRPSVSKILTAQNIGRGVRLPHGNRRPDIKSSEGFASEAEKETFTLDVICYQPGKDNYREIIESSQENFDEVEDVKEDEGEYQQRELQPIGDSKFRISIPMVSSTCKSQAILEKFEPRVNKEYADVEAILQGVDIFGKEAQEELGEAEASSLDNQTKYLIGRLVKRINELGIGDKETVTKVVQNYLKKVPDLEESLEAWKEFLDKHRKEVYDDLESQIFDHLEEEIEIKHDMTEDAIEFKPFTVVVDSDKPEVSKDKFRKSMGVKKIIITGYEKTIFPNCIFDSFPEKVYADVLDRSDSVKKWIRVPKGQFSILTKKGSHSPDFVAETKNELCLAEIKKRKAIERRDPVVLEKAKEAKKWCELASESSSKNWEYRLIPHDEVKADRDFDGIQGVDVAALLNSAS